MTTLKRGLPILLLLAASCLAATPRPAARAKSAPSAAPTPAAAGGTDEAFHASVEPLLLTRCSPCHAPGGKMYDKMPFDKADTIRSHAPGTLKRLKGDDRETVRAWLEAR